MRFFRVLTLCLGLFVLSSLSGTEVIRPYETISSQAKIYPHAFFPGGKAGFYPPGSAPVMTLILKDAKQPTSVKVDFSIQKLYGTSTPGPTKTWTIPANREFPVTVQLPKFDVNGYYQVTARVSSGGAWQFTTSSAFIILPPMGKTDPFLAIDNNCMPIEVGDGYHELGIGTFRFYFTRRKPWWYNGDLKAYMRYRFNYYKPLLKYTDKKIIGAIDPSNPMNEEMKKRFNQGLFSVPDSYYKDLYEISRMAAAHYKGRIKLWLSQEETDSHVRHPQDWTGDASSVIASYVLSTRQIYRGVKAGNPNANVGVLGVNCIEDYFKTPYRFAISNRILTDLGDEFDFVTIDAYSGNWNRQNGHTIPPEKPSIRQLLFDFADLSAAYHRPRLVLNIERSYGVNCYDGYLEQSNREVADHTARSIIINRSAPSPLYVIHFASRELVPMRLRQGRLNRASRIVDGVWRTMDDQNKKLHFVPRPLALSVGLAARELAFVRNPVEKIVAHDIYSYTFESPDHSAVTAIWTIGAPCTLKLQLPAGTLTDASGIKRPLAAGKNLLKLTSAPIYLRFANKKSAAIAQLIGRGKIHIADPVGVSGRLCGARSLAVIVENRTHLPQTATLNIPGQPEQKRQLKPLEVQNLTFQTHPVPRQIKFSCAGKTYTVPINVQTTAVSRVSGQPRFDGSLAWTKNLPAIKLNTPEHVFPKTALIPELGLFKHDGKDISGQLYFGWDERNFYIAMRVNDRVHLQRQSGGNIWKDDCFQFVVSPRFHVLPLTKASLGNYTERDHNLGLALTRHGGEFIDFGIYRKRPAQAVKYPFKITRDGSETRYEAAIPWRVIGVKPAPGQAFRCSAVCFDNNRSSDPMAMYWLAFGQGVAGGQDVSLLNTLILE